VGVGSPCGRYDLRNPQGKNPIFGQLAQVIKERRVPSRIKRGDGMDRDVPLSRTTPPFQRRETAAVSDRRKDRFVQPGAVDHAWHSIRKLATYLGAYVARGFDDDIGAERSYELLIGRRRVRDHGQSVLSLRELDRVPAYGAGSTDDRDGLAACQSQGVQGQSGRCRVQKQRGASQIDAPRGAGTTDASGATMYSA
jgi:hypothetical protein